MSHPRPKIYVLAYPHFDSDVMLSIERFRIANEPERAKLVPPHVTLVFGLKNIEREAFLDRCDQVSEGQVGIHVAFSEGNVVHDPFEKKFKLQLPCSDNAHQLRYLHQQLYDGRYQTQLDPNTRYEPHMTVATHENRERIEPLDQAEIGAFPLAGKINALEIVEFDGKALNHIRTVSLRYVGPDVP